MVYHVEREGQVVDSATPITADEVNHVVIQRKVYRGKGKRGRFQLKIRQAEQVA
jgi:hypothetical protein